MGFIDSIKNIFKSEEQIKADKEYASDVKRIDDDIKRLTQTVIQMEQKYQDVQTFNLSTWNQEYVERMKNDSNLYQSQLAISQNNIYKWQYILDEAKLKREFVRKNTEEDISYRKDVFDNFSKKIQMADPNDSLNLRFHSTTIYYAQQIIESGGIISSIDRLDSQYITSTNLSNEISVSSLENLDYSVFHFTDLGAFNNSLPAGCIFVVTPKDEEESNMIQGRQMNNVYFHENPNQLYAIVTTPENISIVKDWMQAANLDASKVHTFEELESEVQRDVAEIENMQETRSLTNEMLSNIKQLETEIFNAQHNESEEIRINDEVQTNDKDILINDEDISIDL